MFRHENVIISIQFLVYFLGQLRTLTPQHLHQPTPIPINQLRTERGLTGVSWRTPNPEIAVNRELGCARRGEACTIKICMNQFLTSRLYFARFSKTWHTCSRKQANKMATCRRARCKGDLRWAERQAGGSGGGGIGGGAGGAGGDIVDSCKRHANGCLQLSF